METSRRNLIVALAIAPLAACAAPAVADASRTPFAEKIRLMESARAAAQRWDTDTYHPAHEKYKKLSEAIPHTTAVWMNFQTPVTMTTADPMMIKVARDELRRPREGIIFDDFFPACQAIADGADWREAEKERISECLDIGRKASVSDQRWKAFYDTMYAVIDCPVANPADLAKKIAIVTAEEQWEMSYAQEAISADVNRLGGLA